MFMSRDDLRFNLDETAANGVGATAAAAAATAGAAAVVAASEGVDAGVEGPDDPSTSKHGVPRVRCHSEQPGPGAAVIHSFSTADESSHVRSRLTRKSVARANRQPVHDR